MTSSAAGSAAANQGAAAPEAVRCIRVLGPVEVVAGDGSVREVPSPTQRRLLALLAVSSPHAVRPQSVVEMLGTSPSALRTTVSRLRRLIGDDNLRTDAVGYRLTAPVDADNFVDLLRCGGVAGSPLEALDAALALWHGDALDEFQSEPWAIGEATRLNELRAKAVEDRVDLLLAGARSDEAVAALKNHIAANPYRDRARGQLVRAFAADGRQADALRAFQSYRFMLAEEAGTEPSSEVRDIERRVAAGWNGRSDAAVQGPSSSSVSPQLPAGRESSLPRYRTGIVGRERDLLVLHGHLATKRFVSVIGTAGVGKTRLAVSAATAIQNDDRTVWFAELANAPDAVSITTEVAVAVGAPPAGGCDGIADLIGDRPALLVIDNCEHVLDHAAYLIDDLLSRCSELTLLATSRLPLDVEGEHVMALDPLTNDGPAADLFRERAEAAGAVLPPNTATLVEEVCRRLDGIPLAIELACPHVRGLGLESLLDSLSDRFAVLIDAGRRSAVRHRTLHAAIEWSYQLLSEELKAAFRSLGIFSGGFELDAATHLLGRRGVEPVASGLIVASLVTSSMVVADHQHGRTRYRLLESMRAFAVGEIASRGETEAVAAAHAEWVAMLAELPMELWMSEPAHTNSIRLEREVENWRDAAAFAISTEDAPLASRLCGSPVAVLVLGRPDLCDTVLRLSSLIQPGDLHLACRGFALWARAFATRDEALMGELVDLLATVDPDDALGAQATFLAGFRHGVTGDFESSIHHRLAVLSNDRVPRDVADWNLALLLYGVMTAGRADLLDDTWVERARLGAARTDVPSIRLLALIAAALAETDPIASVDLGLRVQAERSPKPLFYDLLLSAFLGRFLRDHSPALAAVRLGTMLRACPPTSPVAQNALVIAIGLLVREGNRFADDVTVSVVGHAAARILGDHVPDVAERSARGRRLDPDELVATVIQGLAEVAGRAT